jgi:ribosomal-protein-alanine N-acetyltransferase
MRAPWSRGRSSRPRSAESSAPPGWQWPVRLAGLTPTGIHVLLRPLALGDAQVFQSVRRANAAWLEPWDATSPDPDAVVRSFEELVAQYEADAAAARALPLVIEVDGRLVGQVNAGTIVFGSFHSFTVGYWVSRAVAGRMVTPTAVALVSDHLLGAQGLHRVEVNIRPENRASLAVARKLGFRSEGTRLRYLHIAGAWRDHLSFALTTEDLAGETMVERLSRLTAEAAGAPRTQRSQESLARHTDAGPRPDEEPRLPS